MSETVDTSRIQRALDVANGIVLSARPKHAAIKASANDVVDLGCAVAALAKVAQAAADLIAADTEEAGQAAHLCLIQDLGKLGYLTLKDPEKTDGSAD
ncbi:MAG: hypothetical protein J0I31_13745 [Rhizobiales bacterium]|nr:hypothetical protein [Hyphomicrobiales bacterium]